MSLSKHQASFKAIALVLASSLFAACGGNGNTGSSSEDVSSTSVSSSSSVAVSSSSSSVISSSSSVVSSSSSSVATGPSAEQGEIEFSKSGNNCNLCHGVMGQGIFGSGNSQFDINNLQETTLNNLAAYISSAMPNFGPSSCTGQCAEDIAAYLKTFVGQGSSSSVANSSIASSSSSPSNIGGVLFEDDFESHSAGGAPSSPWHSRIRFNVTTETNTVRIDGSKSHSGTKSLYVNVTGAYQPSFAFMNLSDQMSQQDKVYLRFYLNASAGLGGDSGHAHLVELSKDGQNGIRYGEGNGSIGVNTVANGDPIYPQQGKENEDLAPNQWYCMEVLFDKTPQYDELTTWVDGREIHRINNDQGQWANIWTNNGPAANWLENAFDEQIQFGWYSFNSARGANTIYFDDIVIANERVGCNYLPVSQGGSGVSP